MAMAAPRNTSNTHYGFAAVSITGSLLCGYSAYTGIGLLPTVPAQWFINFATFVLGAFGLAFFAVPHILLPTKAKYARGFDDNHGFIARFCGFSMLMLAYLVYSLDTATAFQLGAIWIAGAGILGPTYTILYLDPVMTPDGLLGDFFLILIGGILSFLATR